MTNGRIPPRTTTALELIAAPLLQDYVEGWRLHLVGRGQRPSGVASYMLRLRRALGTLTQQLDTAPTVADLTEDAITALRDSRMQEVAAQTTRLELSAVRSFCKYLMRKRVLKEDPTRFVDFPKKPDRIPRALSRQQLRQLWAILETAPPDESDFQRRQRERIRRACRLMLYAGLRLSETVALRWEHIDLEGGLLRVEGGKGGKDRTIPLHPTLAQELRLTSDPTPDQAVIEIRPGEPMSAKSVCHIFDRWLPARGLDVNAHALRHSFASELLRAGCPLPDLQALLGHADLETTSIYLRVNPEHLRRGIDLLPAGW